MKINNYAASKKYGNKTRWCISGTRTYKSGKSGEDYFNQYMSQHLEIYFFINKYGEKYAMVVPGGGMCQIFDDQDKNIEKIPYAPDIPRFRNLEPIVEDTIYENDTWKVVHPRNRQFAPLYILVKKNDEEEGYRFDIEQEQIMTADMEFMDLDEFRSIDDSTEQIYNDFIVDLL